MMDRIFIRDLHIRAIIGVRDRERKAPQAVLVNVSVYTDIRKAAASDDLNDSVDYAAMAKAIRALVKAARRYTLEALAEDIARLCLERSGVKRVRVRVEKPGALSGAVSAGVEIERPVSPSDLQG